MKKFSILILLAGLSSILFAAKPITPELSESSKYGIIGVNIQEAKSLFDKGMTFCDARKVLKLL
jgi:hypothetical protein